MSEKTINPILGAIIILIKTIEQIPGIYQQTEEIMHDMLDSPFENGVDAMRPNRATFVNVCNSFQSMNDPSVIRYN